MILFPNCKINLGLHILHKREDGFHNLETIFYPIPLQDGLEIVQNTSGEKDITLTITGLPVDADEENNICVKAYRLLKKNFPQIPPVQLHLHKVIPTGAGLGGGSADGAFTLLLLNKKFGLGLSEDELNQYALELGSDCPFFIKNAPCYATKRGEVLEDVSLDLSAYKIILVNPGIHLSTAWAFSQIRPDASRPSLKTILELPITEWKKALTNDFETAVFQHHVQIKEIKEGLYQHGAVYASMTGTGSTVYGIFPKEQKLTLSFPQQYYVKEC